MRFISLESLKQINRSSLAGLTSCRVAITWGLELNILNLCWQNTTEGRPTATKRNENPVCAAATYLGTSPCVLLDLAHWQSGSGEKGRRHGARDFPEYPSKELDQATDVSLRMSWGRWGGWASAWAGGEKTRNKKKRRKK